MMVKKKVVVKISEGIDVGNAGKLAIAAERYQCRSLIQIGNHTINLHSLLNLVAIGIQKGDEVLVICDGYKEQEALEKYEAILTRES